MSHKALITGTSASFASSATLEWAMTRAMIVLLNLERTLAVSLNVSFFPSCMSFFDKKIGWPPSIATPASEDTRVRVLYFSKIMATLFPFHDTCIHTERHGFNIRVTNGSWEK